MALRYLARPIVAFVIGGLALLGFLAIEAYAFRERAGATISAYVHDYALSFTTMRLDFKEFESVARRAALGDPNVNEALILLRLNIFAGGVEAMGHPNFALIFEDPAARARLEQLKTFSIGVERDLKTSGWPLQPRAALALRRLPEAMRALSELGGAAHVHSVIARAAVVQHVQALIWHAAIGSLAFMIYAAALLIHARRRNAELLAKTHSLEMSERRLTELADYRRQFLANMSHEFRTPLNAIKGFSELISMPQLSLSSERIAEYAGHIVSSADDLTRLTNDVLDLSKIDAGRFDLYRETGALAPLLRDAAAQFSSAVERGGLTLTISVDDRMIVDVDRGAFKRAVTNLISNAVKFSPSGGQIAVRAELSATALCVSVADCGCGIPKADLQDVWGLYARSSFTRRHDKQGSGLGLAIAKALVESHGGNVEISSTLGKGTTVRLWLPRSLVHQPAAQEEDRAARSDVQAA